MTTCNDLLRRAFRAIGVIAAGKSPTGANAETGLEYLQSLILDLPGLLKNAVWCDVAVAAAYTAREGDRCTVTGSGAVTLPITTTCDGRARPPRDLARVQIIGSTPNAGLWVYSATKAAWANVNGLQISSESPFGAEDDEGLAFMLAVNMAAEYGAEGELGQRTASIAQRAAHSFRSRFKRAGPVDWSRPEPLSPLIIVDGYGLPSDCDY